MDKAKALNVLFILVVSVSMAFGAIQTANLGLFRFEVGDLDYPANQVANMNTLDAAILDKRAGGTITGDLTVTGSITAGSSSGINFQGLKTDAEIRLLACSAGVGGCMVFSSDGGDSYISTGTLTGQYRNSRTGTGP